MTQRPAYESYMRDMLAEAERAVRFVEEQDLTAFTSDDRTVYAVVRCLEIIGEAAKRIPKQIRSAHRSLPWPLMTGMRDKLIHDYSVVNRDVVWQTVREDLPGLIHELRHILIADDS